MGTNALPWLLPTLPAEQHLLSAAVCAVVVTFIILFFTRLDHV